MTGPDPGGHITVFAPARVDLSPGFTDVEPLCIALPGRVVNVALDSGIVVTASRAATGLPGNAFSDRLCAAVAGRLGIPCPALRLAAPALPAGGGLGMSGALSVAVAYALSVLAGSPVRPAELSTLACAAERDAGVLGGTQDQLASAHGGAGLVERHGGTGRRCAIDADLPALGARLVLVHGGGARSSGSIIEQVLSERPRDSVLRTIGAMNRVAEVMVQVLAGGDYDGLAGLMNESTELLAALHPEIVGPGIHPWLRSLGAQGAKPCGAGGRAAVWAILVRPAARRAFVAAVAAAGWSVLNTAPGALGARRTG